MMDGQYDTMVIGVLAVSLIIWLFFGFRNWVNRPIPVSLSGMQLNSEIQDSPAVDLLEAEGYEVIGGKMKVPLAFEADESVYYSRLFIDYVAERDDEKYLVKTSRRRQPLELTGPSLRDRFLYYLLLYPGCEGLLYVDMEEADIKVIRLMDYQEDVYDGDDLD
ncbi:MULTISPECIES: hypothetical protein [Paenibacillus]|uniref:Uncharacterized protein n=1 Tax=Paenibacillus pabuli TaxID=1472 RepID=A0A855YI49_9BACL|nr:MULTISPECIES: hypothetical protein [Paenibacillus]PWW44150.1 hypothetical protein DET56_102383 [Paenibacillus pabuli]PXW10179.1 hypothetical protein DEU73_102383 [Paenibacillus taichungensis]RAJ03645.1 hypothetical protein DET54_101848 [Paenibacillus pabuli]